jgi:hypothetical protein
MNTFEHHGVEYVLISREEAILTPDFPKKDRLKLSEAPGARFVIMKAIGKCDEDRKYICEIEH